VTTYTFRSWIPIPHDARILSEFFCAAPFCLGDRDLTNPQDLEKLYSSVGIATDYGMDDRMIGVRIPAGAGSFSLHHRVQTGSGAHPASYPMGTRGPFPGVKAAGE
jgi:hypothetical protein